MPDGTPGVPEDERIEAAVRAVLGSMAGDLTAREAALLAELEALGRTIARAKAEIAALSVDDITGAHIPSATDELDAIVGHTAEATNEILDSCEILEKLQTEVAEPAATALRGAVSHPTGWFVARRTQLGSDPVLRGRHRERFRHSRDDPERLIDGGDHHVVLRVLLGPQRCGEPLGVRSVVAVQAPHSPSPHPSFVPVRASVSRRASRRRVAGGASTVSHLGSQKSPQWVVSG